MILLQIISWYLLMRSDAIKSEYNRNYFKKRQEICRKPTSSAYITDNITQLGSNLPESNEIVSNNIIINSKGGHQRCWWAQKWCKMSRKQKFRVKNKIIKSTPKMVIVHKNKSHKNQQKLFWENFWPFWDSICDSANFFSIFSKSGVSIYQLQIR